MKPKDDDLEVTVKPEEKPAGPDFKAILAEAPPIHDVLARPHAYEAWHKKAQDALA